MSRFTDGATLAPPAPNALNLPDDVPDLDGLINRRRAATPAAVLEQREVPRFSIAELNELSAEQLGEYVRRTRRDERGPVEKVLDMVDLPRNQIVSRIFSGLEKKARDRGELGTFGRGRVFMSDALAEMGLGHNFVTAAVGLVGDLAFDPLTYIGPAGWGAQLAGKTGTHVVRGAGNTALKKSIRDVAAGRVARDLHAADVIKAAGVDISGMSVKQAHDAMSRAIFGDVASGPVGRTLSRVGGDLSHKPGYLVEALETPGHAGREAAKRFMEKYAKGTEPGLALGKNAGSTIAHIPFTDLSLRVPLPEWFPLSAGGRRAVFALQGYKDRRTGLDVATQLDPTSMGIRLRRDQVLAAERDIAERLDVMTGDEGERAILDLNRQEGVRDAQAGRAMKDEADFEGGLDASWDAYRTGFQSVAPQRPGVKPTGHVTPFAPPGPLPIFDKFSDQIRAEFRQAAEARGQTPDVVDASLKLLEHRAGVWARRTGQDPEDWWRRRLRGATAEPPPGFGEAAGRASIEFDQDGRALLRFLQGADVSSNLHETTHLFTRELLEEGGDELEALQRWAGPLVNTDGTRNTGAWEKVATAGETYFRDGVSPVPELQGIFERLKEWLLELFARIRGDARLHAQTAPEVRAFMDRMLGVDPAGFTPPPPGGLPPVDLGRGAGAPPGGGGGAGGGGQPPGGPVPPVGLAPQGTGGAPAGGAAPAGPAPAKPAPDTPGVARGRAFTRARRRSEFTGADIDRRLSSWARSIEGSVVPDPIEGRVPGATAVDPDNPRAGMEGSGGQYATPFSVSFKGDRFSDLPGEIKDWIDAPKELHKHLLATGPLWPKGVKPLKYKQAEGWRRRWQLIRESMTTKGGASGADAMAEFEDYFDRLDLLMMSDAERGAKYAEQLMDPSSGAYDADLALHVWIRQKTRGDAGGAGGLKSGYDIVDNPGRLPDGTTFRIAGAPFVIETDAETGARMFYGGGFSGFLEATTSLPVVRGSLDVPDPRTLEDLEEALRKATDPLERAELATQIEKMATPIAPEFEGDFFQGERIEYTGKVEDGWREFVYLEGPKKGETGLRPALDPETGEPLFQRDVPGQEGLFKAGTAGAPKLGITGRQRELADFRQAEAPPAPQEPPKLPNESAEEYAERLVIWRKFRAAEENTGRLFQNPPNDPEHGASGRQEATFGLQGAPRPDFPGGWGAEGAAGTQGAVPLGDAYQQALTRLDAQRAEHLKYLDAKAAQAQHAIDELETLAGTMDADAAAGNLKTVDDFIALMDAHGDAVALRDLAMARREKVDLASNIRAASVLTTDRDHAVRQLGEQLAHAAEFNPEALSRLADAYQRSFRAAQAYADRLKGPVLPLLSGDERMIAEHARRVLGIDDESIAHTMFLPMGRALERGPELTRPLAKTLFALDRFWRNTFNVRGSSLGRAILHYKLALKDRGANVERWALEMQRGVKDVLEKHGVPAGKIDEALAVHHALMYQSADPGSHVYHWWEFDEKGPAGAKPSLLLQNLDRARASGLFDQATRPGLMDDLRKVAAEHLEWVKEAGDAEQADHLLGMLMAGHVPLVKTPAASRAIAEQGARYPRAGVGMGDSFAQRRTTYQTRYPHEDGRWRRFFEFDREVAMMSEAAIAEKFAPDPKRLQEALNLREDIRAYDAQGEAFRAEHRPRPTDYAELNQLHGRDRLRALHGDNPAVETLFETNPALVMANRMASHQLAVARANLLKSLEGGALRMINGEDLERAAANPRRTVRLANGVEARVSGDVPTNGPRGHAAGVYVGGELYRMLDPELRSRMDHPLMEMFGKDVSDLVFHHVIADKVEDAMMAATPEKLGPILTVADALSSAWKSLTLLSPTWPVYNIIGDAYLAVSGGADPVFMAKNAANVVRLRSLIESPEKARALKFMVNGQELTGEQVLALAHRHRAFDNSLTLRMASEAAATLRDKPHLLDIGKNTYVRKLLGGWFRANQFMQDSVRLLALLSFMDQGHDALHAEQRMLRAAFDYGDFTRVEEKYFRRLFPFYSWMRSNLGYQFRQLLQNPRWAALAPKLKETLEEAVAGEGSVPEALRPQWMREGLTAQVSGGETPFGLTLQTALPTGDLYRMLTPAFGVEGAKTFIHYFLSSANPIVAEPFALGTGRDIFSGRTIGSTGDVSVGEHLRGLVRPLAEFGERVPRAFGRSFGEGVARSVLGGRVQSLEHDRLTRQREREYREEELQLRTAIRRAESRGESERSLVLRAQLLKLYEAKRAVGLDVPRWAEQQLERFAPTSP